MRTGIFEDEQFYICHDGRELRHLRTESKEQDGYTQTFEVYMVVQTAADVNIKRAVCISMMRRKMPKRTKS